MKKRIFGIFCGHCISAIENKLCGMLSVRNDVSAKTVVVEWDDPATPEKILALLKKTNYPAAG